MSIIKLPHIAFLVLISLAAIIQTGCGISDNGPIIIIMKVNGLIGDIKTIRLQAKLNGKLAAEAYEVKQNLNRFAVTLPNIDVSFGNLEIDAVGLAMDGCKVAGGHSSVLLMPANLSSDAELNLILLPTKRCTLSVQNLQKDAGMITSKPDGISCGNSCSYDFDYGSSIVLRADSLQDNSAPSWAGDCLQAGSPTCIITANRSLSVTVSFAPSPCNIDGVCWYNPLPQGYSLNNLHGNRNDNIWAVGDFGTILHWNGKLWATVPPFDVSNFYGVWVSQSDDVWIVGEAGRIWNWNGTAWQKATAATAQALWDIAGNSANDIWAVGSGGTILHFDGNMWSPFPTEATTKVAAVWSASASDAWAVGDDMGKGVVLRWNGGRWMPVPLSLGSLPILTEVWGSNPQDVWIGGWMGKTLHWDGVSISDASAGLTTGDYVGGIWGGAGNEVWMKGVSDSILKWDGMSWKRFGNYNASYYGNIWGSSSSDIWVLGFIGAISHYDGNTWTAYNGYTTDRQTRAWSLNRKEFFAIGDGPTTSSRVFRFIDNHWTLIYESAGTVLRAIFGFAADDVWAVGDNGVIIHWNGSSWSSVASGTPNSLFSIWGNTQNDIWSVGALGTVIHYNGSNWSKVTSGTGTDLNGVAGRSATDVWAVGRGGSAIFWDGNNWSAKSSGTTKDLYDVAYGNGGYWAVGDAGTIIFNPSSSGTTWIAQTVPTSSPISSVAATNNRTVAIGQMGIILQYNGLSWQRLRTGSRPWLNQVITDRLGVISVIGEYGSILRP